MGEIERERQREEGQAGQPRTPPRQRQPGQRQVAGNADGRYGNVRNFGERAVVHDAAVPFFVDGAGLGVSGVVNAQGHGGNHHAGQGKQSYQGSHRRN